MYPPSHALALRDLIPGARLELIEGLGHELPVQFSDQLAGLIVRHVKKTESRPSA